MSTDKTGAKEYEHFLLRALVDLGGSAPIKSVHQRVEELMRSRLTTVDYEELETGGARWKKNVNFARTTLGQSLLIKSDGSRWAITERGRKFLATGSAPAVETLDIDGTLNFLRSNRDALIREVKRWVEKNHGQGSVESTTVEASLRRLFQG